MLQFDNNNVSNIPVIVIASDRAHYLYRSLLPFSIRLLCERFIIFLYGQYINGIIIKCSFKNILCYEI